MYLEVSDEQIPNGSADALIPQCDTFANMFQTHKACRSGEGGIIRFENAGQLLNSSPYIILNSPSDVLDTCSVSTKNEILTQYETCGIKGDCKASGTPARGLSIEYSNPPQKASVKIPENTSVEDVKITDSTTYQLMDNVYNAVKSKNDGVSGYTIHFEVNNTLSIGEIDTTKDNTYTFSSDKSYSLSIRDFKIKSNGSGNTVRTDTNMKSLKIEHFELASESQVTLQATRVIKMNEFYIGRNSNVVLKAQYVNIDHFETTNKGSGESIVDIYADYIDMDYIELGEDATLRIHPYTSGKRILMRVNGITQSSSSTILISSGNYYINKDWVLNGSSDNSAIRALDENQLVNIYLNHDLQINNNRGINSNGKNGNFGTNPPAKFLLFVNGSVKTGGGGTTFNATIYAEDKIEMGNPTYVRGAMNAKNEIHVGQGQFIYDQSIIDSGWGECNTNAGPADYVAGPFDAWDTFRDDTSAPPADRNISTKIVNKSFKLSLASLNKDNNGYELKQGSGSVAVAIYPKGSMTPISNAIAFDANSTNHSANSGDFIVASAQREAVVGFKLCATYEENGSTGNAEYTLYPASICSSTKVYDCNASTTGTPTWHICYAGDSFAVRPYSFRLFGKNQYKRAGEDFNVTIKAVDETNDAVNSGTADTVTGVTDYNVSTATLDIAAQFYTPSAADVAQMQSDTGLTNVTTCPQSGTFEITDGNFSNGEINASMKFSETGILDVQVSEKPGSEFALVDADDTNDTQRYIKPATSIQDENDIGKSNILLFIPYSFVTTAEYNTTTAKNWLYMNDINGSTTTPKMAAYLKYTIKAYNKDGSLTKNYTSSCFPDTDEVHCPRINGLKLNTTFDLFLDANINVSADANLSFYSEDNASNAIWMPHSNMSVSSGNNAVEEWISPAQFQNGIGEAYVYFNVDRKINAALNPIKIKVIDANTSTSWMDNPGSPKEFTGMVLNQEKIFYYAKAHIKDVKVQGNDANITGYYEVFCYGDGCDKNLLPDGLASKNNDDPRWWINSDHRNSKCGKIVSIAPKGSSSAISGDVTSMDNLSTSTVHVSYDGSKGYPYKTTMKIVPSSWLIYNKYIQNANHNEFIVKFESAQGGWAGKDESNSSTATLNTDKDRILQW